MAHVSTPSTTRHGRFVRSLLAALIAALALVPSFALAAPSNPFDDASARSGAIAIVNSLSFWVWIAAAIGFILYIIAYFGQALVPSWYSQFRDYFRNGAILLLVFQGILQFILSQAQSSGSSGALPLRLALALLGGH